MEVWGAQGDGQEIDIDRQQRRLTSAVCEPVEHVAFVTKALETAGGVDTEMVTGAIEGAFINVCGERKKNAVRNFSSNKRCCDRTAAFAPYILLSGIVMGQITCHNNRMVVFSKESVFLFVDLCSD